uniref:Uncharacterized protein n=1 Tax=Arundo donax TaxID=35708 RepID=A0A0A9EL61_ARUDO
MAKLHNWHFQNPENPEVQ